MVGIFHDCCLSAEHKLSTTLIQRGKCAQTDVDKGGSGKVASLEPIRKAAFPYRLLILDGAELDKSILRISPP